jgi:DNA-directed RNA polymerases I, II, and III subunit RPABC4
MTSYDDVPKREKKGRGECVASLLLSLPPRPLFFTGKMPRLYMCGSCGMDNEVKEKEPIQCKHCGHRILYKKRTEEVVQFEAR